METVIYFVFDSATVNAMERTELKITVIAEQLGLSWTGKSFTSCISFHYLSVFPLTHILKVLLSVFVDRAGEGAAVQCG